MEKLNDDCLCVILDYLNLSEQLTMSKVSNRFRWLLCNVIWRRPLYRKLDTRDSWLEPLQKEEYERFFELVSPSVQHLYITNVHQAAFSSYLGRHLLRPEASYYLRLDFHNLIELRCLDEKINNSMIRTISIHCPQLRKLVVSSAYITGKHISDITHLNSLDASYCSIEAHYLIEILSRLKLMHLLLENNRYEVDEAVLNAPGACFLQNLDIPRSPNFGLKLAMELPRLRSLKVNYKFASREDKWSLLQSAFRIFDSSPYQKSRRPLSVECDAPDVEAALKKLLYHKELSTPHSFQFSEYFQLRYVFNNVNN